MPEEKKLKLPTKYCESIYQTIRRPTRTIQIGKVETGSAHPVRLQTMTTTGEALAPLLSLACISATCVSDHVATIPELMAAGVSGCCCTKLVPSAQRQTATLPTFAQREVSMMHKPLSARQYCQTAGKG